MTLKEALEVNEPIFHINENINKVINVLYNKVYIEIPKDFSISKSDEEGYGYFWVDLETNEELFCI